MSYEAPKERFCLIVGAGVSGIVQAAELLRKEVLRPEEIQVLDRASDYGGVWHAATYPGAACDVFSALYQVSWYRNPGTARTITPTLTYYLHC
jgi:cation diffusion facilitator CzcD-associated flavoprotein CzcO